MMCFDSSCEKMRPRLAENPVVAALIVVEPISVNHIGSKNEAASNPRHFVVIGQLTPHMHTSWMHRCVERWSVLGGGWVVLLLRVGGCH